MVKVLEFCLLFIVVPFFNSPAKLGHFYGMEYFGICTKHFILGTMWWKYIQGSGLLAIFVGKNRINPFGEYSRIWIIHFFRLIP